MLNVLVCVLFLEKVFKRKSQIECVEDSRKDGGKAIDRDREIWRGASGQAGYVGMWVRVQAEPASIPAEEPWMAVY